MSPKRARVQRLIGVALLVASTAFMYAVAPRVSAQDKQLKIVVYGGSGNIGQRIVREALDRKHRVTVVVRNPSRVRERDSNLTVLEGDILNSAQVAQYIAGHDVVVNAVAFRGENPDYDGYRKAAESLVKAMRSLGQQAPYLIVVGGAGSLMDENGGLVADRVPEAFRGEVNGQIAALELYRSVKDVRWSYFSPAEEISPGNRTGTYRIGYDTLIVDTRGKSRISMEDYASALLSEAERPRRIHRRFTIGY